MSRNSKGINAERELIHLFWAHQWAAIRIAGSGANRYPSPDLLVGNSERRMAIECKTSRSRVKYLPTEDIEQLRTFARTFGAEAWLAIKFMHANWHFLNLEDLTISGNNFSISLETAQKKGLLLEELIEKKGIKEN